MEHLKMLQDCYKGNSSVKKTFCWVGFSKLSQLDRPIKEEKDKSLWSYSPVLKQKKTKHKKNMHEKSP